MALLDTMLRIAVLLSVLLLTPPASAVERFVVGAEEAATAAPGRVDDLVVTEQNVYDREIHWPNIAAMTRPWSSADGRAELSAGDRGALIRVEKAGLVRIDFGRHGQHEVPIDHTDLVERANDIREGKRHKGAPNFVLHIGTRLVDPTQEPLGPLPSAEIANGELFLCVFANPESEGFPALAQELATLRELAGLEMIFFPQSTDREALVAVKTRLAENDLAVPFVYPHMSPDYTEALLGVEVTAPTAMLITPNGRLLARASLESEGALEQIRGAAGPDRTASRQPASDGE